MSVGMSETYPLPILKPKIKGEGREREIGREKGQELLGHRYTQY